MVKKLRYTRMLQDYWERRGFADRTVIVAGSAIIGMSFTLRVDCFLLYDVFSLFHWYHF